MAVELSDVKASLSETLEAIADQIPEGSITVRDLLHLVGEQGMILFIMILTIPFLTPVPLPGVSTVFGVIVMLISLGVIANRVPWLPNTLTRREIKSAQLVPVLRSGAGLMRRIEVIIRPRLLGLSGNPAINRLNGVMLFVGGALLILPLPWLPFSNTLPGWALLLMGAGILQRDGVLILLGYVLNIGTVIYFGIVAIALIAAGRSVLEMFREATPVPTATPGMIFIWLFR